MLVQYCTLHISDTFSTTDKLNCLIFMHKRFSREVCVNDKNLSNTAACSVETIAPKQFLEIPYHMYIPQVQRANHKIARHLYAAIIKDEQFTKKMDVTSLSSFFKGVYQ